MATNIRPEISERSKYWISKHRHYELKHFCLQYPAWKREYAALKSYGASLSVIERLPSSNTPSDPTASIAIMKAFYLSRIDLIERTALEADKYLHTYILKAVTEGLSYTQLKHSLNIPCSRDTYYDRYRRFFWLLDKSRK